jgi:putative oxidoreductase
MLSKLFRTPRDGILTMLRLTLGVVFLGHGAQKMLGWFGGYGYHATMGFFTQQMHIPAVFAFLAIAAEFFGGLGLLVGLLSRIAAFGITVEMLVAAAMVHIHNGFFMNWTGTKHGEGFEFHLLALALLVMVLVRGAGALSFDRLIYRHLESGQREPGEHGAEHSLSHA